MVRYLTLLIVHVVRKLLTQSTDDTAMPKEINVLQMSFLSVPIEMARLLILMSATVEKVSVLRLRV